MTYIPSFVDSFPHTRKFGLELEFFGVSRGKIDDILTGANISCWDAGYYDSGKGWKITDDSSIEGDYSVELVSPILSGIEGLQEVAKVVRLMAEVGAQVNRTCGFHVHVDAQDLSGKVLLNVYRRYALHEDKIDQFMVKSRRGNNNTYCKSTRALLDRTSGAHLSITCEDVARLVDEHYVDGTYEGGRYNKVNLCAYLRHGTIEFRHHGGTMDINKVINWITFCVNFVEVSQDSETEELFAGVHPASVEFFNNRIADLA